MPADDSQPLRSAQPGKADRGKRRHWGKLVLLLLAGGVYVYLTVGGRHELHRAAIEADADLLRAYADAHYWNTVMLCIAIYTLATALSIPGAWMRSLATGFLLGPWAGTAVIVVSATIGAVLTFLAARYLFADQVYRRLERNPATAKLINGFERDAFNYLLFLRIVPLFPFWLVNLVPAFTPVRVSVYAVATAIGIAPGSYALAALGQSLGPVPPTANPLGPGVLAGLVVLGVLALLPVIVKYRAAARRRGQR